MEGNTNPPNRLGGEGSPVSENRACAHRGFPGTWEARLSPPKGNGTGTGLPAEKAPGLTLSCLAATEANNRHSGGTVR